MGSCATSVWEPESVTAEDREARLGATGVKLFLAFPELGKMASDRGERVGSGPAPSFVAARGRLGQADVDGTSASSSRLAST